MNIIITILFSTFCGKIAKFPETPELPALMSVFTSK